MRVREALWRAAACYRFTPSQVAGRAGYTVPRRDEAGEQARGIKAAATAALHSASGASALWAVG